MPTAQELYGIGGGIPEAPQGSVQVGAVDAQPGSKLYDLMQRQRATRPRQAKRRSEADALASLLSKFEPGAAVPAEGMVPFGDLPQNVRQVAGQVWQQPLVGVDPRKLDTQERFVLEKLRRMNQQDISRRVDANPQYAIQGRRGGAM